jgi:hypothetical protein
MKKTLVTLALLILGSAGPAGADTVSGAVTGGTAQTAGGTFVLESEFEKRIAAGGWSDDCAELIMAQNLRQAFASLQAGERQA